MKIEKFPDLVWRGRRLIWDSRQAPDGRDEIVFVGPRSTPEITAALTSRERAVVSAAPLGAAASEALGNPSAKLCVLAVTGTNGKTSCTQIMRRVLAAAGHPTAEIGTLGISLHFPGEPRARVHLETGFTTPEAPTLHHFFSQLPAAGVTHVVMEASSHAMELGRIEGVDFDGALFTNLTRDHLDFHGTMEAYESAKRRLFTEYLPGHGSRKKKIAVINAADAAGLRMLRALPLGVTAAAYERGKTFEILRDSVEGLRIRFDSNEVLETHMVGAYNAENIAGSVKLCELILGDADWPRVLETALREYSGPSGRMERVPSPRGLHVFVDYAHTPDALEKALRVLRASKAPSASLTVVFGCGGDRDKTKRPIMGRVAAEIADRVIVTSDNPRTENPRAILDEILAGAARRGHVESFADRREAIGAALKTLRPGDVCLVAGKGHELYQVIGDKKIPFSDVDVCAEILGTMPG